MTSDSAFFQTRGACARDFPIIGKTARLFSNHWKIIPLCLLAALTARADPGDFFVGWTVGSTDGSTPNILCTTNGWQWFQQGGGQVPAINFQGVASAGSNIWIVGEANGGYASIYHSGDDGATWVRQGDAGSLPNVEMG